MKIPQRILDLNDRIGDVLNYTLIYDDGIDLRVLDVIVALGLVFCIIYYWRVNGAFAAVQGGALYAFTWLCIYYFYPSDKRMK